MLTIPLLYCAVVFAQPRVTIPWSNSLNIDFGYGSALYGQPLSTGKSGFSFTQDPCPPAGSYTSVKSTLCPQLKSISRDAGHFFMFASNMPGDSGYMMLATQSASLNSRILFTDTLHQLCDKTPYLFWAAMLNTSTQTCIYPNFTIQAETLGGQVIQSYQTGNVGGPGDKGTYYPGYFDRKPIPLFAYYGGEIKLPTGVTDVVVKIIANPSNADAHCTWNVAVDNILFMPRGPEVNINAPSFSGGWISGSCIDGAKPVKMDAAIGADYLAFGSPVRIPASYSQPGYQWQGSVDGGFHWFDLPGQNTAHLSYVIKDPPGMYVRLRVAEIGDIANANCSNISNILHVVVDSLPADAKLTANSPVCTDADLVFKQTGGASYQLTGPNGFSDNSAFPHINEPKLSDSGWYYSEIISFGGCRVRDSVFVKVIGPNLQAGDDTAICYGQSAKLWATGGQSFLWSPATGLSNPLLPNPLAKPLTTTKYQVKTIDENGCSARRFVTVTLRDSLLRAVISGTDIVCAGDIVQFADKSIGKIASWLWDFGNGVQSSEASPPAQSFRPTGIDKNYPVILTVTDSAGCSSSTTHKLYAPASCQIAMPNAFTPNGDGKNDYFYPLNAYKTDGMEFLVYNRYGQLLFRSTSYTGKWDGRSGGYPQEAGMYVWVLRYTDRTTKRKISSRGSVLLIR